MKKYAVYPGTVISRNDGDVHYITASKLIQLYGVDPAECVVIGSEKRHRGLDVEHLIPLYPQYDGDYSLSTA